MSDQDSAIPAVVELITTRKDMPHIVVVSDMDAAHRIMGAAIYCGQRAGIVEHTADLWQGFEMLNGHDVDVLILIGVGRFATGWVYKLRPVYMTCTVPLDEPHHAQMAARARHPQSMFAAAFA